jgi:hypothetical protein
MLLQTHVKPSVLDWLLEPDTPDVRYLALRDLLDTPADDADLMEACTAAHKHGTITHILDAMHPDGYWVKPGAGYSPKYHGTVWSVILLAQLGASLHEDARVEQAVKYVLDHTLAAGGKFAFNGKPYGTFDCLQGNLCAALLDLGCDDPRLDAAFEWMARTVTGEGMAPAEERSAPCRYLAYKCGPLFACAANGGESCAWGAAKVMLALSKLPPSRRTPLIGHAIEAGIEFLFSVDPATAEYPTADGRPPSSNWWKFGFPVFYITDLLQVVEALALLGQGGDTRFANALALVRDKQDASGRWALDYNYGSKTWGDYGRKGQPNKWVTLRALRALQWAHSTQ